MENKELIIFLYENIKMNNESLHTLLKLLDSKDNKIKEKIEKEVVYFDEKLKEITNIMKDNKIEEDKSNLFINIASTSSMYISLLKDNSDAKVASIIIKGYLMGVIDLTEKVNKHKKADKSLIKFTNELIDYQQKTLESYKKFL